MTRAACALAIVCAIASPVRARVMPLEKLPEEKILALAPLLRHAAIALVESAPSGAMKQVTLLVYVAAPPETVHAVIAHPGEYKSFVANVSRSTWEPRADGGVSSWKIELPVGSFEQRNAYAFEPGPLGAITVTCVDEREDATFRWETLRAPGGGTVLVQYGYSDVKHSNAMVRAFLARMPVTEHGLALAAQLMLADNMRREAERRGPRMPSPPDGKTPGFEFLLARGQVVVLRAANEVSLIDRVAAPPEKIAALLERPAEWARFIPGVEDAHERARTADTVEWVADFTVPLVTWTTGWIMRRSPAAFEGVGTSGDLQGAHFRWDLMPRGAGETMLVYRVTQSLGAHSLVARKLFQFEPALEPGLNVAFSLVYLRAIRERAEKN